jgi:aspartate/methionine/tyrosine aminotransferase
VIDNASAAGFEISFGGMALSTIDDFALERWFARFEFAVEHQLSASDVEPYTLAELLPLADADARDRWNRLSLAYTESLGLPALREAIAALYSTLTADDILVVAGAEEGIFLLTHALLEPGDEAIVVTPAYQSLQDLPAVVGARVHRIPLRFEDRWQLDPEAIAAVAGPRTRFITINFPHNPTGAHITRDVQQRIIRIAEQSGATLLSDEVYRGLESESAGLLSPAADLSDAAVSLGVMSKSFALPGLRIGWIATRNRDILQRVARLKDYTTICSSAPSEILALIALRAADRVLARSRAIVGANRQAATAFFATHSDVVEWVPSVAGSTAFPRLKKEDAQVVAARLREKTSTLMVPGRIFQADASHFRLGLGRRDLPVALENLGKVLRG